MSGADCERLVEASAAVDANSHLIVLLGGEVGLRCGEDALRALVKPT